MKKILAMTLVLSTLVVSGCGYLLYPERKGLQGGKIDPTIVLLDGAGLLFGFWPGVVAFAVDFTNGTIYLRPGEKSAISRIGTASVDDLKNDPQWISIEQAVEVEQTLEGPVVDLEDIAEVISQRYQYQLNVADMQYQIIESNPAQLAELNQQKTFRF